MISRRTLIGSAGAALLAGGAAVAIKLSEMRPAENSKDMAPDFSVEAIGGLRHYQLADFAGRLLLLNFWATWCGPCRVEMPWLSRTYSRYRSQGLTILGVNTDDDSDMPAVERFAREMGVTYPIARNNDATVSAYGGLRFLPESFLIGQHGEILQHIFGMPASTHDVEAEIVSALSRR
jgi:thiol-disulfide isomerase/thioredoxin